jgi:hypothetical protein
VSEISIDFLGGTSFSSRLIEKYGGGPGKYSHCASVIVNSGHERYLDARDNVIAGIPAGVRIREINTEAFVRKQRATLAVSQADYDVWEAGLRAKITTEYDKSAILGFLEGKSMHTAGQWICSALAINGVQHMCRSWTRVTLGEAGLLQRIGFVPFPLTSPAHEISPNALLLILDTAGFTIGPVITP